MKQQDKILMIVGSTAVLLAAGVTGAWLFGKTDAPTAGSTSSSTTSTQDTSGATSTSATTSTSTSTSSAEYGDGTYNATTNYSVPKGDSNSLTATLTIQSGKISTVMVNHDYSDRESGMYIDSFENALQSAVVGKSVDGLSLGRIGGASLTTHAFDDALATIRTDAKG